MQTDGHYRTPVTESTLVGPQVGQGFDFVVEGQRNCWQSFQDEMLAIYIRCSDAKPNNAEALMESYTSAGISGLELRLAN